MATYTDFFNDFTVHPDTHDLAMKTDSRAIQQSLRNLVLTNTWERPYQPKLGGNIRKLLFAECSEQVANALQKRLEELIDNFEKRVVRKEIKVEVNPTGRSYNVWIEYYELNNPAPTTFYIELKRIR
jgi:phage baseplate assembly protein W